MSVREQARRRWDLADDDRLVYVYLITFDRVMHSVEDRLQWLRVPAPRGLERQVRWCEPRQLIWFERASALFVFNFDAERSLDEVCH